MPKSLADGHIKLTQLAARPADILNITVTEATAGRDISCDILLSDYSLGPTGSDTVAEKALCTQGNFNALGASNYDGSISPFRMFDGTTKQVDETEDATFQALKDKGTLVFLLERESAKDSTDPWATDDEYNYFEAYTDEPARIDMQGFIKRKIKLAIQNAKLYKTIVAGI